MGTKILTKTDAMMEDRMLAVGDDPERADTLAKARAFKRTWLELAEALQRVSSQGTWARWGYPDFDSYCRRELHLRGSTVQKLLGSYRFLESAAPRVIERAREEHVTAPIPSIAAVDFVKRATEVGHADEATMESIRSVAFDQGAEPTFLKKQFAELAFPVTTAQRKDKLRGAIVMTAKRLSSLICENDSPVPKALAKRLEETIGELMEAIELEN
jgi:hypothetical protein